MANKDLINLGIAPDSGTGDSARRGGEKINNLMTDIYTQFGDAPVGNDPTQPFYGYRRPFFEYEYKVGELHPAGKFIPIEFKTTDSRNRIYDSEYGYGYDNTGTLIDTDGDGIPDIYRDSEWYFLSRGEVIDADFSKIDSDNNVNFVLPIGVPGDQIIVRDGFGTWNNTINDKGIHVNFWTTPFEFQSIDQVLEWEQNTNIPGTDIDSETLAVFDPISGNAFRSNWHKVKAPAAIEAVYPKLDQPFAISRSTNPYDGLAPTYVVNSRRYQYEFLFSNYNEGWIMRQVALDAADVGATLLQFGNRLDGVDSDLDRGLYVSADSDLRYSVPIFRRTADGREIHGTLALRGDQDSVMTTIDSEDTSMVNDPRGAGGGDSVQPLTTTVRFKLRDDVKIKNNLLVGNDLEVGHHLQVGETLTIDSDLAYFNNRLQVRELATFDSDVLISGELRVMQQSVFEKDVRFNSNIWVGGDSTSIQTETLRVADNIITLANNNDNAGIVDTGFIFQRYDQTDGVNTPLVASDTVYNVSMVWDETNDLFKFGETVSSDSDQVLNFEKTYLTIARDLVNVNSDLTVGHNLAVGDAFFVDSDRVEFIDSDGQSIFSIKQTFLDTTYDERPRQTEEYTLTFRGNVELGRDSDDVVIFNSRIASNLVPYGRELYSLGDSDNPWKDLHLAGNTIHLGSIKLSERDGTLYIYDSEEKRISLDGADGNFDNFLVDSELVVGGTTTLLGNLLVSENATFDSDVNITGRLDVDIIQSNVNGEIEFHDDVVFREKVIFDSDVVISNDLSIDSDFRVAGSSTFGEDVTMNDSLHVVGNATFDSDVNIVGILDVDTIQSNTGTTEFHDDVVFREKVIFDSDVVISNDLSIDSDFRVAGSSTFGEDVTMNDSLHVVGNATFDSDVNINGILDVDTIQSNTGLTEFHDDVIFREKVIFDSDVVIGNDLRVDSDAIIQGQLYVGENVEIHDTLYVKGHATLDSDVVINGGLVVHKEATFKDDVVFEDNAWFDSDVTIVGSLTVNGTTTYVNTTNLEVADNFIVLNKNQAAPFNDIGLIFQRFDSDSVDSTSWNATIQFDELTDSFQFGETGSSGITTNPGISNVWLKIAESSITATSTIIADSDIVVAGTLTIPGYNSVTHHLQLIDSDMTKMKQRLDSDEIEIQNLRTHAEQMIDSERHDWNASDSDIHHKLSEIDSDLAILFARTDSDDNAIQALRINIGGDSDEFVAMPLDGRIKFVGNDAITVSVKHDSDLQVLMEVSLDVVDGGTF